VVAIVLGAVVWMVLRTQLLGDIGQTLSGWLGIS
jgi:hypothetical protein